MVCGEPDWFNQLAGLGGGLLGRQHSAAQNALNQQRNHMLDSLASMNRPVWLGFDPARDRNRTETTTFKRKPDTILDELQQEVDQWLENTI